MAAVIILLFLANRTAACSMIESWCDNVVWVRL